MPIRSLTAPSIAEAMREARTSWGDGVVLLESVPPSQGQAARITVMVDDAPVKVHAGTNQWIVADELPAPKTVHPQQVRIMPELRRPGALFSKSAEQNSEHPARHSAAHFPVTANREERPQLRAFEDTLPHLTSQSTAHGQLLDSLAAGGFRADTANELHQAAMNLDLPFPEAVRSAMASRLPGSTPVGNAVYCTADTRECATSFTLRLASHWMSEPDRALPPLVVVLPPANAEAIGWLDPSPLYRSLGLPVQTCLSADDRETISKRAGRYEGLLVDAGTESIQRKSLGDVIEKAQHIHVIDASRRQGPGKLQCHAVACMHLSGNWIAAAQTLIDVNRPVSAIVHGVHIEKGLKAYRSRDFANATLSDVTW